MELSEHVIAGGADVGLDVYRCRDKIKCSLSFSENTFLRNLQNAQ